MDIRKLHRLEPQAADRLLGVELIIIFSFLVVSVIRGEPLAAIVSILAVCLFIGWRFCRGPIMGPVIVGLDEKFIKFNDPTFTGKTQFTLDDVQEIRIVGPRTARRVRVHTRSGKPTEAYRGLRGKRLMRIVLFLRENLPKNVPLIEDEPPSWSAVIRGDF